MNFKKTKMSFTLQFRTIQNANQSKVQCRNTFITYLIVYSKLQVKMKNQFNSYTDLNVVQVIRRAELVWLKWYGYVWMVDAGKVAYQMVRWSPSDLKKRRTL